MAQEGEARIERNSWPVVGFSVVSAVLGLCSLAAYFGVLFLDTGFVYLSIPMASCAICLSIAARMTARKGPKPKSIWLSNLGIVLGVLMIGFFALIYFVVSRLPT